MGIGSVLIACLPSAITGFCFWCIEQKIQKQSKKLEKEEKQRREAQDKREKLHEQQELFLVQGVNAAIALGEATARAVQRTRLVPTGFSQNKRRYTRKSGVENMGK